MTRFGWKLSRRFVAIAAASVATVTGVGAASIHRYVVSQQAGSEGATAFVQTASSTTSALQGEVASSANTSIRIPFGILGDFDPSRPGFGIGVAGVSTTGYAIAGESLSDTQPSLFAFPGGKGPGFEAVSTSSSTSPAIYAEAKGSGDGGDFKADGNGVAVTGTLGTSTSFASAAALFQRPTGGGYTVNIFGGADTDTQPVQTTTGGLQVLTGCFAPGQATNSQAILAASCTGEGLNAITSSGSDAVDAQNYATSGQALLAPSSGEAVVAIGQSSNAAHPALLAQAITATTDPFATYARTNASTYMTQETFVVQGSTGNRSGDTIGTGGSDVQVNGDVYVVGQVFQNCAGFPAIATGANATYCSPVPIGEPSTSVAHSSTGTDVRTYAGRQSLPTIEDFGEATLQNGRAYVRLDPAFARTIATTQPYLLFITSEGESRGLYAANRTLAGFEVHEMGGGHSSVAFDYRIVAKPLADTSARFVAVKNARKFGSSRYTSKIRNQPPPVNVRSVRDQGKPHLFVPQPIQNLVSPASFTVR